jgi:hypothetical protein
VPWSKISGLALTVIWLPEDGKCFPGYQAGAKDEEDQVKIMSF